MFVGVLRRRIIELVISPTNTKCRIIDTSHSSDNLKVGHCRTNELSEYWHVPIIRQYHYVGTMEQTITQTGHLYDNIIECLYRGTK